MSDVVAGDVDEVTVALRPGEEGASEGQVVARRLLEAGHHITVAAGRRAPPCRARRRLARIVVGWRRRGIRQRGQGQPVKVHAPALEHEADDVRSRRELTDRTRRIRPRPPPGTVRVEADRVDRPSVHLDPNGADAGIRGCHRQVDAVRARRCDGDRVFQPLTDFDPPDVVSVRVGLDVDGSVSVRPAEVPAGRVVEAVGAPSEAEVLGFDRGGRSDRSGCWGRRRTRRHRKVGRGRRPRSPVRPTQRVDVVTCQFPYY